MRITPSFSQVVRVHELAENPLHFQKYSSNQRIAQPRFQRKTNLPNCLNWSLLTVITTTGCTAVGEGILTTPSSWGLLGLVGLVVLAFLWYLLRRRTLIVSSFVRDVEEVIGPERMKRAEVAIRKLRRLGMLIYDALARKIEQLKFFRQYRAPGLRPGDDERGSRARIGAWIILIADIPLQALQLVAMGIKPPVVWLALMAAALAVLFGLGPVAAVRVRAKWDRGDAIIRRAWNFFWVGIIAVASAGIVVLAVGRVPDGTLAFVTTTSILVGICLAEGAAVAGACLGIIADTYRRPIELQESIGQDEDQLRDIDSGIKRIEALVSSADLRPSRTAPLYTASLILLILSPVNAEAQGVCLRLSDVTASVDRSARAELDQKMKSLYQLVTRAAACDRFAAGVFTSDTVFLDLVWFSDLGEDTTCFTATPAVNLGVFGSLPRVRQQVDAAVNEQCRLALNERTRAAATRWKMIADSALLLRPRLISPRQPERTAIADVLRFSFGYRPRLVVLETDGVETLKPSIPSISIPPGTTVIILLLPSGDDFGGSVAASPAAEEWVKKVPGLIVLPFTRALEPGVWDNLLRQGGRMQQQ